MVLRAEDGNVVAAVVVVVVGDRNVVGEDRRLLGCGKHEGKSIERGL